MAYSLLHIFILGVALIINLDAKIIKLSNIPSGESVLKPRSLHLRNSIQVCRDFSTIFLVSAFVSFVELVLGVVLLGNRKFTTEFQSKYQAIFSSALCRFVT